MGSKTQTVQQQQTYNANPLIQQYGGQALAMAQNAANQSYTTGMPVQYVAPFSSDQLSAFQETRNAQGMASPYYNAAANLIYSNATPNVDQYYNREASGVFNSLKDIYGQQQAQNTGSLVNAAGGVGADRIAVGQANMAREQDIAAGQTGAQIYSNAANQALSAAQLGQQAGYGLANVGTAAQNAYLTGINALLGTGSLQQQENQAYGNAAYNWLKGQFQYPFETGQYLSGITSNLAGGLGGTTTGQTTSQGGNWLSSLLGTGLTGYGLYKGLSGSNTGTPTNTGARGGSAEAINQFAREYQDGGSTDDNPLLGDLVPRISARPTTSGERPLFQNALTRGQQGSGQSTGQSGGLDAVKGAVGLGKDIGSLFGGSGAAGAATAGAADAGVAGGMAADLGAGASALAGGVGGDATAFLPLLLLAEGGAVNPFAPMEGYDEGGSADDEETSQRTGADIHVDAMRRANAHPITLAPSAMAQLLGKSAIYPEDVNPFAYASRPRYDDGGEVDEGYQEGGDVVELSPDDVPSSDAEATARWRAGVDSNPFSATTEPTRQRGPADELPAIMRPTSELPSDLSAYSPADRTGGMQPPQMNDTQRFMNSPYAALVAAGLGMMSGTSPFALTNIGRGGLQGLQALQQQQQNMMKQAELGLKRDQFDRQMKLLELQGLEPKKIGQNMMGQEIYGIRDPKTGKLIPIDPNTGNLGAVRSPFSAGFRMPDGTPLAAAKGTELTPKPEDAALPPGATYTSGDVPANVKPEILQQLDPQIASQVKALSEGRMAFPSGFALKSPYWQHMLQLVSMYDPSFDAVNYNARAKTRGDFTAGVAARNITSLNTVMQHVDEFSKAGADLNNFKTGSLGPLTSSANAVTNWYRAHQQDPRITRFEVAANAISNELEKAFRGSQTAITGIHEWRKQINPTMSPEEMQASTKTLMTLLGGRMDALADQYNRGMGTTKDGLTLLSPKAQDVYNRLSGTGPAASAASAQGFTGRTATGPGGARLRETTDGQWVP